MRGRCGASGVASLLPEEADMALVPAATTSIAGLLAAFAVAFPRPTFEHVQVLVTGTLLSAGPRTVAAALGAVGLGEERHFTTYHRVLNRAKWSPLLLSRVLLHLLTTAFLPPDAPLVLLIDGTLERRWGPKISLKGRYH